MAKSQHQATDFIARFCDFMLNLKAESLSGRGPVEQQ